MKNQTDSPRACQTVLSRRATQAGCESIINTLMARTLAQPNLISLAAGFADQDSLPVEVVTQAYETIASDPRRLRAALQYGTTIGYGPLRDAILQRLLAADKLANRNVDDIRDCLLLTAGSNELLFLTSDALLDPGDIVLCSSPSYFVYLGTLANLGARAVGIASDECGIIPEALEEQLDRFRRGGDLPRVKIIYVTTYFDNPRGVSVSASRRARILEIAQRWSTSQRLHIIEDSAYRELRYEGEDLPSLWSLDEEGDTVIHAGSFSKSFSPGIRVGWGVVPRDLIGPVLAAKGHIDFGSPNFSQHLMAEVMLSGGFERHVSALRDRYRRKLDAVVDAAMKHLVGMGGVSWRKPEGGMYLWLELPEGIDAGLAGVLFDHAVDEGVLYIPGEPCYPAEGAAPRSNALRLSFGIPTCEAIATGVAGLAAALRKAMDFSPT